MDALKAGRLRRCGNSGEGAGANDEIVDRVDTFAKSSPPTRQASALHAILSGKRCAAAGVTAFGNSPALELCRALIKAGHDPDRPLHVFRGTKLALVIRSIREGAKLTVEDDARGTPRFRLWRDRTCGAASPTRRHGQAGPNRLTRGNSAQGMPATLNEAGRSEILVPDTATFAKRFSPDG